MPDERENGARVLEAYGDAILRLAYSYLRSRTDAEDVLQDTLVQYLTGRPEFAGPEHEKAWLMRVAINLCKNQLSAPWKRRWEELDEDQPCYKVEFKAGGYDYEYEIDAFTGAVLKSERDRDD